MTLIASDGYEYEDLAQRLLGRPKKNTRNDNIRYYIAFCGAKVGQAYARGFDAVCPEGDPGPSPQFKRAHDVGLFAAGITRGVSWFPHTS